MMSITEEERQVAIEDLKQTVASGRNNEFIGSLWKYYEKHDTLTDNQAAALLRGIKARGEAKTWPDVPAGHYAVGNPVSFYKVTRPTEGNWAGYSFLDQESGGNHLPIKNSKEKRAVLEAILADPAAAAIRYGQMIGRCGFCHTKLTDDESRESGVGPDCAEKRGIDRKALIAARRGFSESAGPSAALERDAVASAVDAEQLASRFGDEAPY